VKPSLRSKTDLALVLAAKAATSLFVLRLGFRAISDDDFARVVIAQRFALAPSWDPSSSSWLPLPFWLTGSVMSVFGRSLAVARVAAFVLGLLAVCLVYAAGHWLRLPRSALIAGTLLSCSVPWFMWTGVTTTPEALTAALLLLGAASCARAEPRVRTLGAGALSLACLSRYEAWPVAASFALICIWDAYRQRSPAFALAALSAVLAPSAWLLHGLFAHGDALFFVGRVVSYRRALGGLSDSFTTRLFAYPQKLLQPRELIALAALVSSSAIALRISTNSGLLRYRRPALLMGALLLGLILGELRDGSPTHHAERALLSIWLLLALFTAELGVRVWLLLPSRQLLRASLAGVTGILVVGLFLRSGAIDRQGFAEREAELEIGGRAARELASAEASSQSVTGGKNSQAPHRLLIHTPDFGYFAVMAGFAEPEKSIALGDHDPRRAPEPDPLRSPESLRAALQANAAHWLVVPLERAPLARSVSVLRSQNSRFGLFELRE
jgi:hypothetical protein